MEWLYIKYISFVGNTYNISLLLIIILYWWSKLFFFNYILTVLWHCAVRTVNIFFVCGNLPMVTFLQIGILNVFWYNFDFPSRRLLTVAFGTCNFFSIFHNISRRFTFESYTLMLTVGYNHFGECFTGFNLYCMCYFMCTCCCIVDSKTTICIR